MASPVDTSVKFAHSTMAGASTINGVAGSRIAAIKAFAVTGFGVKTVDAGGTISGGKCRLPFSSGASAAVINSVILVAGATPAGLNGEQKVTSVSSSWVEFATALPDGAVTGTVSFKMAPLGWEEVFSKTNVSVFRPTDPASSRPYLRIDDSNATYAIVQMYESMTDVDTGVNGTPARYWAGRSAASASAVSWTLVGDSRGIYVGIAPSTANASDFTASATMVSYFGDVVSDRSGDAYPALLTGCTSSNYTSNDGFVFFGNTTGALIMRIAAGIGGATSTNISATGSSGSALSGADGFTGPFPSRAAQALFLSPIMVADGGTFSVVGRRGLMPGIRHCPQSGLSSVYTGAPQQIPGTGDYQGKTMLTLGVGTGVNIPSTGVGFVDVTGPWRPQP